MLQRQATEQLQMLTRALDRHAHADRTLRVRCHLRLAEWLVKLDEMEDESCDGSRVLERTASAHRFIRLSEVSDCLTYPACALRAHEARCK
jgi:hypothetical protein